MERTYGPKYSLGLGKTLAQIAALIRADIKAAIASGELPAKLKVSVVTRSCAIDVRVKDGLSAYDAFSPAGMRGCANDEHVPPYLANGDRWTQVERTLNSIHAAYNHDGSDVMTDYFDVRYYGSVSVDWEFSKSLREAAIAIHRSREAKPFVRYQHQPQACAA